MTEGFTLPQLPYAYDSLEPYIDKETITIHHDKHHRAYVDKLNKAVEGTEFAKMEISELIRNVDKVPEKIRTAVRNNGGGHFNHALYWQMMAPNAGGEPSGKLAMALKAEFGSFDNFKKAFTNAALTRFGSGWAWLVLNNKKLEVTSTANQECPLSKGQVPLLTIDVWEHAYYLKYQNKRPDYVENFWKVVNWKDVEHRFEASI